MYLHVSTHDIICRGDAQLTRGQSSRFRSLISEQGAQQGGIAEEARAKTLPGLQWRPATVNDTLMKATCSHCHHFLCIDLKHCAHYAGCLIVLLAGAPCIRYEVQIVHLCFFMLNWARSFSFSYLAQRSTSKGRCCRLLL